MRGCETLREAFLLVKSKRTSIQPNEGFLRALGRQLLLFVAAHLRSCKYERDNLSRDKLQLCEFQEN